MDLTPRKNVCDTYNLCTPDRPIIYEYPLTPKKKSIGSNYFRTPEKPIVAKHPSTPKKKKQYVDESE